MDNRKETAAAPISQIDYSDLAKAIAGVLISAPMTAAEINAALGTDYTPRQIANAVRRISGASAGREVRMTVGANGLRREKEYAVYALRGAGTAAQPSAGAVREKKPSPADMAAEKRARAQAIAKVLGAEPMTVREINAALGADYEALQVSNAVKSIPGTAVCKVTRTVVNRRCETVEKTYTAYFYEG